jgi:hypothetical protein
MRKIIWIFNLTVVQFALIGQVPAYVPTTGLMGYWSFSGNANDISGNNLHGTNYGASSTADRAGVPNSAYHFNGSTNYIETNFQGILGTNARAVSFWARTANGKIMAGVAWGSIGTAARYEAGFNYGAPGPLIDGGNGVITFSPVSPVNDNQWHHYVMQMASGSTLNQVEIYQDGGLLTVTSNVYSGTNVLNTILGFNVVFGRISAAPFNYFDGDLDDIGIWNRKLSQCEITNIYTSGQSGLQFSVSQSNSVVCSGTPVTFTANIFSGSPTFSWSNGVTTATNVVTHFSPGIFSYSVTGTSGQGCSGTATLAVKVDPKPVLSVIGNNYVCKGSVTTLTAFGAFSYKWHNGSTASTISISQQSNTYSFTGVLGLCSSTMSGAVAVLNIPTVSIVGRVAICKGEQVTLVGHGADDYEWNASTSGSFIILYPQETQTISVQGSKGGCTSMATAVIKVSACTNLAETALVEEAVLFPNPGTDQVTISPVMVNTEIVLLNSQGQLVDSQFFKEGAEAVINIEQLPGGVYFVLLRGGRQHQTFRFIKIN